MISLSLGAARAFGFRLISSIDRDMQAWEQSVVDLNDGGIVIMGGQCQSLFQHCIFPLPDCTQTRFNLTFRFISKPSDACIYPHDMDQPDVPPDPDASYDGDRFSQARFGSCPPSTPSGLATSSSSTLTPAVYTGKSRCPDSEQCQLIPAIFTPSVPPSTSKLFNILSSNITYFSPKVQSYICTPHNMTDVCAFAFSETHMTQSKLTECQAGLTNNYFRGTFNPAVPTTAGGSHGGEVVATKSHIDSCIVDPHVLDGISKSTGIPVKFAARYVRLQKFTLILVATYFLCSVGPSDDNFLVFKQPHLLQLALGLPLVILR